MFISKYFTTNIKPNFILRITKKPHTNVSWITIFIQTTSVKVNKNTLFSQVFINEKLVAITFPIVWSYTTFYLWDFTCFYNLYLYVNTSTVAILDLVGSNVITSECNWRRLFGVTRTINWFIAIQNTSSYDCSWFPFNLSSVLGPK